MDITRLSDQLNTHTDSNTVLVFSVTLYDTITYIKSELGGVKLRYEPVSVYHKDFLNLLASLDVDFVCSNQDLLDSLKQVQPKSGVLVGNAGITTASFIKSAFINGFPKFTVSTVAEMERVAEFTGHDVEFVVTCDSSSNPSDGCYAVSGATITEITYDGDISSCQDVAQAGRVIHTAMETAAKYGHYITSVTIGSITGTEDIAGLKDVMWTLRQSLPDHVSVSVSLDHKLFASSMFLATKVLEKGVQQDGTVHYTVNMSLFGELACYLDQDNQIDVIGNAGTAVPSVVYGNTYDEEDLFLRGRLAELQEQDWVFLKNVAFADCRDMQLCLLDEQCRIANTVETEELCSAPLDLDTHLTAVEIQA